MENRAVPPFIVTAAMLDITDGIMKYNFESTHPQGDSDKL